MLKWLLQTLLFCHIKHDCWSNQRAHQNLVQILRLQRLQLAILHSWPLKKYLLPLSYSEPELPEPHSDWQRQVVWRADSLPLEPSGSELTNQSGKINLCGPMRWLHVQLCTHASLNCSGYSLWDGVGHTWRKSYYDQHWWRVLQLTHQTTGHLLIYCCFLGPKWPPENNVKTIWAFFKITKHLLNLNCSYWEVKINN